MACAQNSTIEDWLHRELDNDLSVHEQQQLAAHLATCPSCAEERRQLRSLALCLADSRIEVRAGFRDAVMASLPQPAKAPQAMAWTLPVAMLLVFGVASAWLITGITGSARSSLGLVAALLDMLATATLAGAGLLGASWEALRLGLREMVADSPLTLLAFLVVVVGLNMLLITALRRRQPVRNGASAGRSGGD